MSPREKILELLDDDEVVALLEPDFFDKAIIGIARRYGQPAVVAYDRGRCIDALMEGGMDHDGAEEYFELNTAGAWVGEATPVFISALDA
jgi:hypothetical protein